jgi:hypothetical protein
LSLLKKSNLLSQDKILKAKFNYDFTNDSNGSLISSYNKKSFNINFYHTDQQRKIFSSYLDQFGASNQNLGFILSRSLADSFYRKTVKEIRE